MDPSTLTGEARFVELYETKGHKPDNNGLGQCSHCGRPVHEVDPMAFRAAGYMFAEGNLPPHGFYRHNPIPRTRVIPDRERTHCSSCNKPGAWYEFKPGDGRCNECAP